MTKKAKHKKQRQRLKKERRRQAKVARENKALKKKLKRTREKLLLAERNRQPFLMHPHNTPEDQIIRDLKELQNSSG